MPLELKMRRRRNLKPEKQGHLMDVSVVSVVVEDRYRKDMGDIPGLAASIAELGLLQPIILDTERKLVAGGRRLEAIKTLGWPTIMARVFDFTDLDALKVERDENDQRKEPTISEKVALAEAILGHEKKLAEQRKKASQFGGGGEFSTTDETGKVRDIIAAKVGLGSSYTLTAAQKVVADGAPELIAAMDAGKVSIDAARRIAALEKEEQAVVNYDDKTDIKLSRGRGYNRERRIDEPEYGQSKGKAKVKPAIPGEQALYDEGSSLSALVLAVRANTAIISISKNDPNAEAAFRSIEATIAKHKSLVFKSQET
jgi:ParB-like chromosome segregation protein Spo0J